MTETPILGLPLVQAAQAQKHVTVNEALARLDTLTQLVAQSRQLATPPQYAVDGDCYIVAAAGVNAWAGQDGKVAFFSNGGWVFVTPRDGWSAWVADESRRIERIGGSWVVGGGVGSPSGASCGFEIVEADVTVPAGGAFAAPMSTPATVSVIGITGIVVDAVTGTLTSWKLGVSGSDDRYGSGLGLAQGSWVRGLTGSPQTYYSGMSPYLTPVGGDFAGGTIRLAIHYIAVGLPGGA